MKLDVKCVAPGCDDKAVHTGKAGPSCGIHYQRFQKNGSFGTLPRGDKSFAPEYRHWINMRSRCNTPSSTGYARYGGRGIVVCEAWQQSFDCFLSDMGPRPAPGYTVEREDVNGNYEPNNCRWATRKEQARNKQNTKVVSISAGNVALADAVDSSPLKYNTVLYRLRRGWSADEAVTAPLRQGRRK